MPIFSPQSLKELSECIKKIQVVEKEEETVSLKSLEELEVEIGNIISKKTSKKGEIK